MNLCPRVRAWFLSSVQVWAAEEQRASGEEQCVYSVRYGSIQPLCSLCSCGVPTHTYKLTHSSGTVGYRRQRERVKSARLVFDCGCSCGLKSVNVCVPSSWSLWKRQLATQVQKARRGDVHLTPHTRANRRPNERWKHAAVLKCNTALMTVLQPDKHSVHP